MVFIHTASRRIGVLIIWVLVFVRRIQLCWYIENLLHCFCRLRRRSEMMCMGNIHTWGRLLTYLTWRGPGLVQLVPHPVAKSFLLVLLYPFSLRSRNAFISIGKNFVGYSRPLLNVAQLRCFCCISCWLFKRFNLVIIPMFYVSGRLFV